GSAASISHADATIAVATNFALTAQRLQAAFTAQGGNRLTLVNGSTGKLYAQITRGAPFDVFLAADATRPALLEQQHLAVAGSRTTYAYGTLVLWQSRSAATDALSQLQSGAFRRLAIANPQLAPYGAAAEQTLEQLGLLERFRKRIVRGQNIGQAYAMVRSGNAELGFIAAAALPGQSDSDNELRFWTVPAEFHAPIEQQLVLLKQGQHNATAKAFLQFLDSSTGRRIIQADGYRLEHQRAASAT
ncbi:MAG: molybdate ABC transporter substrate-binding protein, partial [Pseudomonadales bacterium]